MDRPCLPVDSSHLLRAGRRLMLFAPVVLTACSGGVLDPRGPVGHDEVQIMGDALAIMLAVVVPVILMTAAFAWWFRASNTRAKYLPDWSHSGQIELVVWFIPLLVILLLSGVIWTGSHTLDPAQPLRSKAAPLEVQVVSLDWKWLFIYPAQGIASVNSVVVPAGTPVHFSLTSASVMSAFFVPQLGSMIYTMNGMTTQLNLAADRPGTYPGRSSHYNGEGFSDMHFALTALPPAGFAAWVAAARAGPTLDAARYQQLERQSVNVRPATYGSVAPRLFDAIVTQRLAPAPGPQLATAATVQPRIPRTK